MSATVAPARNLGRVQGTTSSLDDLTLHDGQKLKIKIGGGILPTPKLTRTVDGASNVEIPVLDPNRRLLRMSLLSAKFDAQIDGLAFRYLGAKKSGDQLSIRLIDRTIARLQEFTGPKRWFREETTRAEVIKALFEEAVPGFPFYCPQLHDVQPIEKRSQGKKAKDEATANRGQGIGDVKGLTVKGDAATSDQVELGDRVLRVCESEKVQDDRVWIAAMATVIVENECSNAGADGAFQVIPSTASSYGIDSHDVEQCTSTYLRKGFTDGVGAVKFAKQNPGATPGQIAQHCQGSAFPERYDEYAHEAREWVAAFKGGELGSGSLEVDEPFELKVGDDEDYWDAGKRLAKDVNWRLFVLPDKAVYMPETELIRGQVRLAIDADTPGIEDIDFDFNVNKAVNEATITAVADEWKVPPAAVVTVADYGPLSIGSGEAPVKADSKGRRAGVSPAIPAKTLEGKGRFLLSTIESDLDDDPTGRLVSITIKRPTPPLPEPAPESKTLSGGTSSVGEGDAAVQRVLEFCEREIGKPYDWGAFGPDGYDCSGFVSKALTVGDFATGRMTTVTLAGWGEAGPGEFITVHDKAHTGDPHTEHVLIEVLGTIFECGGVSGGVGKPDYSASELAEFSIKRHPKGY